MPVWWRMFASLMLISLFGMALYRSQKQKAFANPANKITSDNDTKSISLVFALLSFALVVFYVGQRSYMFDSFEYQYFYTNYYTEDLSQIKDIISGKISGKGKLFTIILVLFKHFTHGADYTAWFTFVAIIQCAAVAFFLYKYSMNYALSAYLFFTSSCMLWFFNGMRQFLAVALLLFSVDLIVKRKTIPFFIIVFIAFQIHSSAALWIPLYFMINMKPWSKKFIWISIIFTAFCLILLNSSFFSEDASVELLNDPNYSSLVSATNKDIAGVNPIRVIFMSIPAVIAFWRRKKIEPLSTPLVDMWINLSVITSECYIIGMFTTGVMGRIGIYPQMFNYLLWPWLLKNAFDDEDSKIAKYICVVVFMLYFLYDMYIAGNGIYCSVTLGLDYT